MAKIMVVEDDQSLREIYSIRLTAEGFEIVSAGDGEEALALAVKEKPDLILSDVMMPKISGFDMLDILRQTPETKNIKVIMMTALSSEDQRRRGEGLGADKYLVKSQVGIEDVIAAVHEVLGSGVTPMAATAQDAGAAQQPQAPAPQQTSPVAQPQVPTVQPTPVAQTEVPASQPELTEQPAVVTQPMPAEQPVPVAQPVPAEQPASQPLPEAQPQMPVQPVQAQPLPQTDVTTQPQGIQNAQQSNQPINPAQ